MVTEQVYGIVSILLAASIIICLHILEKTKLQNLVGSYKAIIVITILIVIVEAVYLSISFRLLEYVIETVTSLSAVLIFFAFVYLNKLQNAASGLSIAISPRINVGDLVEIEDKHGKIVQLGLTKTIVELDKTNGKKMWIPNKKFDEVITILDNQQSKIKREIGQEEG